MPDGASPSRIVIASAASNLPQASRPCLREIAAARVRASQCPPGWTRTAEFDPAAPPRYASRMSEKSMRFAPLVGRVAGKGAEAWRVHFDAARQRAQGRDVILLTVGDPDQAPPPAMIEATID